ncbi:MAG: hypothetical protein VX642_08530, partial [Bdellovibrionota bacterium]|nr:hypothetical protein [Bdellovibrionota bacterium]
MLLSSLSCSSNSSSQSSLTPITDIEQIKGLWKTEFLNAEYYYKINEDGTYRQLVLVKEDNQYHVTEGRFQLNPENSSYTELPKYDSCNGSSGLQNTKGIGLTMDGQLSFYIGQQSSKFEKLESFPDIDRSELKEVCFKPAFQDFK